MLNHLDRQVHEWNAQIEKLAPSLDEKWAARLHRETTTERAGLARADAQMAAYLAEKRQAIRRRLLTDGETLSRLAAGRIRIDLGFAKTRRVRLDGPGSLIRATAERMAKHLCSESRENAKRACAGEARSRRQDRVVH